MKAKMKFVWVHWRGIGFMVAGLAGLAVQAISSSPTPDLKEANSEQSVFFETKIRPLLADKCLPCHGKTTQLGGLRLDTSKGVAKGGDSGPAVVAGETDKSLLILAVRQTDKLKMPQGGKLGPNEVANLEAWVRMGAPWPKMDSTHQPALPTLWSLEPVRNPQAPKTKNKTWAKNPIDAFVLAKLEAKGLAPTPAADKRSLIRRVTYDLTGLPPTADEVEAFVTDRSSEAYEKVVDRLLASPRYGERWARHWMDVARYADSKGYVFNEDRNYPNAYTYRRWLIDAINKDLPYDRFIVEQLAADRLPDVQSGTNPSPLAALGFLTLGRRFLNSQPDIIDDRIDVTMRGFEGFTVACARCHDHKFDPIPTQDYYSLYSVFASSSEKTEPISGAAIDKPWQDYNAKVADTESNLNRLVADQVKRLREENEKSTPLSPEIKQTLQSLNPSDIPNGRNLEVLSKAFEPSQESQISQLDGQLDRLRKQAPPAPEFAMAMEDKPNPGDGKVFKRGNPDNPGETAPRRFLLALSKPGVEREHWTKDSGRLELAEAIASRENPLTARVFVNRAWMHHFGAGIVRTPSDFGHQGEPPTDPNLLDYLATYFMNSGWSMKKLQRLIVTSSTYQQSSAVSTSAFNADPDNRLWSRMNRQRLDLEEMRDSLMCAAGKLDVRQTGVKSEDLWSEPFTGKRAVYGYIERQNLPGIFRTFDLATPDSTSPKRFVTTVPQQALFFMNSPLVVEEAKAASDRPEIRSAINDTQRIRRIYRMLFGRLPDADETALGLRYIKGRSEESVISPLAAWKYGCGSFDPGSKTLTNFTPFDVFSKDSYHPTAKFPDPSLGYLVLNHAGGHPGHDASHAVVRRWTALADMTITISGTVSHGQKEGDGIRASIVGSRVGILGQWQVHNGNAVTNVPSIYMHKGDTIDFVVDPLTNDGFDSFSWSPVIKTTDAKQTWDANSDFGPPAAAPMTRLNLYVQALMMTNEFMFVD